MLQYNFLSDLNKFHVSLSKEMQRMSNFHTFDEGQIRSKPIENYNKASILSSEVTLANLT